jgi:RHS repeat-associated protein
MDVSPVTSATTTVLTSSPNPSTYGQPVTLTAAVSPSASNPSTPAGTVTFLDGLTEIGTDTLDASGLASFTTAALAPGDHLITADYAGDANYAGSAGSVPLTVNQPLKEDGPASDTPGNVQTGDPIDVNTGNVYRSVEDYSTAGSNPLSFTRYYDSYNAANAAAATLGERWRSTFDRDLHFNSSTSVTVERATGQVLNFALKNGVWTSDSDVDYALTQSGPTWTLTGPDDTVETYADNGSGLGVLGSIRSRDGYTQSLQYNASHQLALVTDSFGRTLGFTYQNGLLSTLTTPDGLVLTYGYSAGGIDLSLTGGLTALTSVKYPTGPPTSLTYDYTPTGLLQDVIDQAGHTAATFTYDASDRATEVYTGGDLHTGTEIVSYNDADGSRTVTDALGLRTVYRFALLQGVPKVTEIDRQPSDGPATTSTYTYDANGYVASHTDWNGNVTRYVNDAHGQPTSLTEAAGTPLARTTTIAYLSNYHLPARIVAPGLTTDFTYDANGNLLNRTETDTATQTAPYATAGQQHTWTYTYDALGHVLSDDGPRTDVNETATYTYDARGNLSTVTDALGHVTSFPLYSPRGLPLSMTDANGVVTTFAYDPMGRLLSRTVQTAAGFAITSYAYDNAGLLISLTQPDNSVTFYRYDTSSRLIGISDPAGETITYTLDGMGNVLRQDIRNSGGAIVETQSQVFNQLNERVRSIGAIPTEVTSYGYDADGNITAITDPLNHTTTQAFDALNRLTRVTDPLKGATQYGYDAQDNNVSVTTPRGLTTGYAYNGFGQEIEVSNPDTGITVYHLDPAGNRVSETDARGVVTNRTFDGLNRVTSETYPASPGENVTYSYDSTAGGNKGVGRLTGYTDETGSTSLTYDALGDVTNETDTVGGIVSGTSYKYNLAGHVTQITYPSRLIVSVSYDSQGRVNGVSAANYLPIPAPAVSLARNVTYEPFGPLLSFTYGNGLVTTRSYDADYRLTGITTQSAKATVQNESFGYDAAGNVTSIIDAMTPANSQSFTYDAMNRLATASGAYSTVSYTYDADSNRLTSTQGGATQTYSYSPTSDLLMSVTGGSGGTRSFTYSASGNMATDSRSGQGAIFTYSNGNRLSQAAIAGGNTATYLYNALGERLTTTVGGVVTQYHYNQAGQVIAESNGKTGATSVQYVWLGGLPLAQIQGNGAINYIHADQTNTPQKMTNASQAVVWDREQQPFGETTSTTGTATCDLRAPGQVADPTSGLDYNMNRDYDPTLGRYIEADPIGLAGGVSLYGYVGQNPVNASDPLGLCSDSYSSEPDLPIDDPFDSLVDDVLGALHSAIDAIGEATDWLGAQMSPIDFALMPFLFEGAGTLYSLGLRASYIRKVEALGDKATQLFAEGKTSEEVARIVSQMRRDIGIQYKNLTLPGDLLRINERNLRLYGDKLGPTVELLREQGYTWEQVIEKASRTGGADLGLGKP